MPVQRLRTIVQSAFVLLCLWIGVEFHLFMRWAESGGAQPAVARPPGVEAFLPISALMSLRHLWLTGEVHPVHPAGLFILLAVLGTALLLRKAFCGWMCPFGLLSEVLTDLGRRLLGRNLAPPRPLDALLRSLKYLLLAFFVWAILAMAPGDLLAFLDGPYNRVADLKMYRFFQHLDAVGVGIMAALVLASAAIRGFWCRYLCPYGALLGLLGLASPLQVTRREATCTDCRRCTRACPSRIAVHRARRVASDECTACYRCVEACPEKETLEMRLPAGGPSVPGRVFAVLAVGLFVAVTGAAMLAGRWRNVIAPEEYLRRVREMEGPAYRHNRGRTP